MFFFFQAEDGIRDKLVTGVQTCALPIFWPQLKPNPAVFPALARLLLTSAESEVEMQFGTVVFDDLTIFYDIVGPHTRSRPHSREAYRLAYLSIRHMLFRSTLDEPPIPPF